MFWFNLMNAIGCTLSEAKGMDIEEAAFYLGIHEELELKKQKKQDKEIKKAKRRFRR